MDLGGGRPYNLRNCRKKKAEGLSVSPPHSSSDSSTPPPPRSRSGHRWYRRQRSKRLTKPRSQPHNAVPTTPPHEDSVLAPFPVAEDLQLSVAAPALGYSEEHPWDITSEEEDQKPNIDGPLSSLKPPPATVRQNASTMFLEKSLGIIERVKSLLVSELLELPNSQITTMISKANRAFTALDCYGHDYVSFYWTVRRFIHFNQELLVAETILSEHCAVLEEVKTRYEGLVVEADDNEEALLGAKMKFIKAKESVAGLTQRLEEARSLMLRLEMELENEKTEVFAWECEVGKCSVFRSGMEARVERAKSEEEEAQKLVNEVSKRCQEASNGIELITKELGKFKLSTSPKSH